MWPVPSIEDFSSIIYNYNLCQRLGITPPPLTVTYLHILSYFIYNTLFIGLRALTRSPNPNTPTLAISFYLLT